LNCRKAEEVFRQLPCNTQVFKVPATDKHSEFQTQVLDLSRIRNECREGFTYNEVNDGRVVNQEGTSDALKLLLLMSLSQRNITFRSWILKILL